jgi:ribosomal-protein-serine acetyltransferase
MNPLMIDVPTEIATARLRLTVPKPGDGTTILPSVLDSLAELKPWLPWATDEYNAQSSEEWCRKCAAEFITREQLAYCIYLGDAHVGNISVFRLDWRVPGCEIGYWLHTRYTGHGYMAEAVDGIVEMLHALGMVRVNIRCDENNPRSSGVAERCGFALDGTLRAACRVNGTLRNDRIYSKLLEGKAP